MRLTGAVMNSGTNKLFSSLLWDVQTKADMTDGGTRLLTNCLLDLRVRSINVCLFHKRKCVIYLS